MTGPGSTASDHRPYRLGQTAVAGRRGRDVQRRRLAPGEPGRVRGLTVGDDTATGQHRCATSDNGPANQNEGTRVLAFQSDGATVYAAGFSDGATVSGGS